VSIQLPNKPWSVGDSFETERGLTYTFDGVRWLSDGHLASADGHGHDDLASKIDLEELQVEVDALATTREAGRWKVVSTQAVRPGEVNFLTTSMSLADNAMTVSDTDLDGKVHGWANLAVGDFVEVVQETVGVRNVGSYGLFKITADNGGTGMRMLELTLDQGQGSLTSDSNVFIKVFHANNDLDLAELDDRYAIKNHYHDARYAQKSHSHGTGRRFRYTTSNSPNSGYFFVNQYDAYFSFTDLNGTTRRMTRSPDFSWPSNYMMTVWNMDGELCWAADMRPGSNYSSASMKLYINSIKYNKGLVSGQEYDTTVQGYW